MWFPPNVWPAEVPELRAVVTRYTDAMRRVADDLLELCAGALDLPAGTLTSLATNPTWTFNINRYPPLTEVGEPAEGQYRIGPHTDFGTVTVLDREPGAGGLQVFVTAADDPDGPGRLAGRSVRPGRADGQHRRPARSSHSLAALGRRFANAL